MLKLSLKTSDHLSCAIIKQRFKIHKTFSFRQAAEEDDVEKIVNNLTLSWQRLLSYRNQSIDLRSKSTDWFLYDNGLRHERVKEMIRSKIHVKALKHQDCIFAILINSINQSIGTSNFPYCLTMTTNKPLFKRDDPLSCQIKSAIDWLVFYLYLVRSTRHWCIISYQNSLDVYWLLYSVFLGKFI